MPKSSTGGIVRGLGNVRVGRDNKFIVCKFYDRTNIRPNGLYYEVVVSSATEENARKAAKGVDLGLATDIVIVPPEGEPITV